MHFTSSGKLDYVYKFYHNFYGVLSLNFPFSFSNALGANPIFAVLNQTSATKMNYSSKVSPLGPIFFMLTFQLDFFVCRTEICTDYVRSLTIYIIGYLP